MNEKNLKKTKKGLASLAIAGMAFTMLPFNVFASYTVPAMGNRLAGYTAYDTAQEIAQQYASADSVVLAAGISCRKTIKNVVKQEKTFLV